MIVWREIANVLLEGSNSWKRGLACWLQLTVRAAENPRTLADLTVLKLNLGSRGFESIHGFRPLCDQFIIATQKWRSWI